MRIFLIGFMGSGKSYIGRHLAKALQLNFVDLDDWIEAKHQQKIIDLFARKGETFFRKEEQKALHEMARFEKAIIACGGGTPCFFDNIDWINRNGFSIYLQASPALLCKRLSSEMAHRPVLQGHTPDTLEAFIEQKLAERAPFYEQASVIVDQDHLTESVTDHLEQHLLNIIGH
ncbi:MAG: shikimate kinase [Saprospiraceae bacterium]|nr:shikimate kinase [Saprospiraceae bacterium]